MKAGQGTIEYNGEILYTMKELTKQFLKSINPDVTVGTIRYQVRQKLNMKPRVTYSGIQYWDKKQIKKIRDYVSKNNVHSQQTPTNKAISFSIREMAEHFASKDQGVDAIHSKMYNYCKEHGIKPVGQVIENGNIVDAYSIEQYRELSNLFNEKSIKERKDKESKKRKDLVMRINNKIRFSDDSKKIIAEKDKKIEELSDRTKVLTVQNSSLKKQNSGYKGSVKEFQNTIQKLKQELSSTQNSLNDLKVMNETLKSRNTSLNKALNKETDGSISLNAKLAKEQKQIATLQREIRQVKDELAVEKDKATNLQKINSNLEKNEKEIASIKKQKKQSFFGRLKAVFTN